MPDRKTCARDVTQACCSASGGSSDIRPAALSISPPGPCRRACRWKQRLSRRQAWPLWSRSQACPAESPARCAAAAAAAAACVVCLLSPVVVSHGQHQQSTPSHPSLLPSNIRKLPGAQATAAAAGASSNSRCDAPISQPCRRAPADADDAAVQAGHAHTGTRLIATGQSAIVGRRHHHRPGTSSPTFSPRPSRRAADPHSRRRLSPRNTSPATPQSCL